MRRENRRRSPEDGPSEPDRCLDSVANLERVLRNHYLHDGDLTYPPHRLRAGERTDDQLRISRYFAFQNEETVGEWSQIQKKSMRSGLEGLPVVVSALARAAELILRIRAKGSRIRVGRPPGHLLLGIVEFFVSRVSLEEVFVEAIEDIRTEHADALRDGRRWLARAIVVRGWLGFWCAWVQLAGVSLAKVVFKWVGLPTR